MTAPEDTSEAVDIAERQDCVVEAGNHKELMYILFREGTSDSERERVYSLLNDRLDPNPDGRPRHKYEEWGLDIPDGVDPETDDRFVEMYLHPHDMSM